MAETVDIGSLFFHRIRVVSGTPLVHTARTQEVDPPFRAANSKVVRLWPTTHAIVLGRWRDVGFTDEADALVAALHIPGHDGRIASGWAVATDDDGNLIEKAA